MCDECRLHMKHREKDQEREREKEERVQVAPFDDTLSLSLFRCTQKNMLQFSTNTYTQQLFFLFLSLQSLEFVDEKREYERFIWLPRTQHPPIGWHRTGLSDDRPLLVVTPFSSTLLDYLSELSSQPPHSLRSPPYTTFTLSCYTSDAPI
jgi:hypothetical protein